MSYLLLSILCLVSNTDDSEYSTERRAKEPSGIEPKDLKIEPKDMKKYPTIL